MRAQHLGARLTDMNGNAFRLYPTDGREPGAVTQRLALWSLVALPAGAVAVVLLLLRWD